MNSLAMIAACSGVRAIIPTLTTTSSTVNIFRIILGYVYRIWLYISYALRARNLNYLNYIVYPFGLG
jgi:hypothetical protein